ncbi:MAG: serine/threonine-protein kinase [Acidobacteriota bacterium]
MTPERWQRVETLFEAALEQPPEQQETFLDRACGDDTELRRTLSDMLACDPQADRDLKGAIVGGVHLLEDDSIRHLGPYRLLQRIGAGGMGQVYLAERADQEYEQRVAIKLVRAGSDGRGILQRFRRERQILASLQHPNIARLLDGGTAPDGRPYLVMEYIEGQPIDRYCQERRLGLRARLELFQTICRAVQHAHQQLIVHRDLKPGNILITDDGTLKLLDFGIAKILSGGQHALLDAGSEDPTTAAQPLTWSYASPEQIQGEPITTATDVYSLGVVLYQLLTGERPYDLADVAPREALRRLCEQPPPAPSARVDGDSSNGRPGLDRRLRGDLDAIALTALHPDRTRRYGSAEQLALDLGRYLTGRPVIAHPDTLAYRSRKFLRRNRLPVAVALAFATLVLAFAASRSQQAERIARERDKAEEVAGFLVDLFRISDPRNSRGETLTVREMLDEGAARIPRELGDNALVRADLMHTIGRVYRELGLYDRARPMLEEALAVRRAEHGGRPGGEHGAEHPEIAESLSALGGLAKAEGDYEGAERQHRRALAILERHGARRPAHRRQAAEVRNELALVLRSQGRYEEAETLFRQALATYRDPDTADRDASVTTLGNLALVLENRQRYDEAEGLMRQALESSRELYGEPHPLVATHLNNLAFLRERRGDYDSALPLYRQALAMRRQVLEPHHPEIQQSLNNLGAILSRRGEYAAAEAPLREALELARRYLGNDHPGLAPLLNNLALVLKRQQDTRAAEPLYREALDLRRRHLGERHAAYAASLDNLASLLFSTGDLAAAEPLFQQALEVRRETLGTEHVSYATSLSHLARLAHRQGDSTSAVQLQQQALDIRRSRLGEEHPRVASSLSQLAEYLAAVGELEEAERCFRQALAMRRELLRPGHPSLASTLTGLGELLVDRGDSSALNEAETLLREALDIRQQELEPEHWQTAVTASALGGCLVALERLAEAEPLLEKSLPLLVEAAGGELAAERTRQRLVLLRESSTRGFLNSLAR